MKARYLVLVLASALWVRSSSAHAVDVRDAGVVPNADAEGAPATPPAPAPAIAPLTVTQVPVLPKSGAARLELAAPAPLSQSDAEQDNESLRKVTKLFEAARKAVGGEHVLLTATAYVGKAKIAEGKLTAGVAGIISLPLLGIGGEHFWDWYPVLATDDSTAALANFQEHLQRYTTLLENAQQADTSKAFDVLVEAARALAREVDDTDADNWKPGRALKLCLDDLDALRELEVRGRADRALLKARTLDVWASDQNEKELLALTNRCDELLTAVGKGTRDLMLLINVLKTYWKTVRTREEKVPSRHNFLLGPSIGIPVTKDPTQLALLGGLAEIGGGRYFRVAFASGIQIAYDDPFKKPGWYCGLALSGALGDDLVHLLNGGLAAARQVSAAVP